MLTRNHQILSHTYHCNDDNDCFIVLISYHNTAFYILGMILVPKNTDVSIILLTSVFFGTKSCHKYRMQYCDN